MARRLKPKQYEAALMIAQGDSDPKIIKALKLRRNTLNRWRRLPEFYDLVMQHVDNTEQAARFRFGMMQYVSITALSDDIRWNRDSKRLKQVMELVEYCRTFAADTNPKRTQREAIEHNDAEAARQCILRDSMER